MYYQKLYTSKNLIAESFERVVHGGRGDYIELTAEQIKVPLVYRFDGKPFNEGDVDKDTDIFYYWLCPERDPLTKIYYQLRTVDYADYKVGYYYMSPSLLIEFKDPDKIKINSLF